MGETLKINRLFIATVIILSIGVLIAGTFYAYTKHLLSSLTTNRETVYYYLPKGSGLLRAAYIAERDGIVEHEWQFRYAAIYLGLEGKLRSGEFEIFSDTSLESALTKIASSDTFKRKVSIPEGYSNAQVMELLKNAVGIDSSEPLLATPIEGTLLPETYFYERGDTLASVIERMEAAMQSKLTYYWDNRAQGLPLKSPEEAVILASIVEKETGIESERPIVASVFINRIKKNMRLQSDPTIIYGITEGLPLERPISRKDIRTQTAYNTYRIDGLPPTAIANPGEEAIRAVLNPHSEDNYLYFVADGTGGHVFAENLQDHNKNVKKWRAIERARKQQN
jgi:UPF0755 protein